MTIKISGGAKENGVVIGNSYDKYSSNNPIVKWMMKGFESTLSDFVIKSSPNSIHEIGCGEGYWVLKWNQQGLSARGCDFSSEVIDIAKENAKSYNLLPSLFTCRNIYDLEANQDSADLVVCCEVLEHIDNPEKGLEALQRIVKNDLIISVPREPLWCLLNMTRGKYISRLGNTPGHIQHWSKSSFINLVSKYFDVIDIRSPLPWTMLLCRSRS
ncbi:class I SAM-dependent methyltransferase [Vibrio rhizosphaerae]|uniref:Class I SAM-dependent methyltransferase n=1 Tax=Vibrio rhizosphaerae TaxID=398736 RepID=A0ABU4IS72_9VIBR|nr:class I SAM-dependent methyltransferase [Vibrio rhizosphaerae]MDW6091566.1 class I SAM-dependent methyltransferase [Vibrio rhizosphaerae]